VENPTALGITALLAASRLVLPALATVFQQLLMFKREE
jgi:hypothetical protein